jgi:hypothetical protein
MFFGEVSGSEDRITQLVIPGTNKTVTVPMKQKMSSSGWAGGDGGCGDCIKGGVGVWGRRGRRGRG